jgi:glycosyltransferase involved in cell wall biosynthesis
MSSLRALVVSYVFPPVGGAGVQRVLKLVKYLPQFGVHADVLTAREPSVPLQDQSLLADIPADTRVLRARTLEPGYGAKRLAWQTVAEARSGAAPSLKQRAVALGRRLLIPDPQLLWLPGAQVALGRRLLGAQPDDVVFISGPPFSQFLLAALARLRRGTALVLDYRDEWTMTSSAYEMSASTRLNERLESMVLRRAHAVTTATEEFRETLLQRFPWLEPSRVHAIPNGYDPDDFAAASGSPPDDRFVLTYSGSRTPCGSSSLRGSCAARGDSPARASA